MATRAYINVDRDRVIGERNRLIFGHFIEHFHRQIYGGVYDPSIFLLNVPVKERAVVRTIAGDSPDAFNDVDRPDAVTIEETEIKASPNEARVEPSPHSVTAITLEVE